MYEHSTTMHNTSKAFLAPVQLLRSLGWRQKNTLATTKKLWNCSDEFVSGHSRTHGKLPGFSTPPLPIPNRKNGAVPSKARWHYLYCCLAKSPKAVELPKKGSSLDLPRHSLKSPPEEPARCIGIDDTATTPIALTVGRVLMKQRTMMLRRRTLEGDGAAIEDGAARMMVHG